MKHVFGRNPMFSGTRKDYYFHYSAADLAHDFVSELFSAIQADVCRAESRRQTLLMPQVVKLGRNYSAEFLSAHFL